MVTHDLRCHYCTMHMITNSFKECPCNSIPAAINSENKALTSPTTKKNKAWTLFCATFQRGSIVLPPRTIFFHLDALPARAKGNWLPPRSAFPCEKDWLHPALPHPPAIPRAPPLQTLRTLSAPSTQRKSKPARSRPLQTLHNLCVPGLPKIMLPLPHSLLEPWCVRPPRSSTRPSLHAHEKTRNLGILGSRRWSGSRSFGCVRRGGRGCDDENGLWLRRADVALMSQRQTFGRRRRLG